jgi:hypothetical protein
MRLYGEEATLNNTWYYIAGIILLAVPIWAAWRRKWWAFGIYVLADLFFLNEVLRGNGGWDELADLATLVVIVMPIYLIGTIVWVIEYYRSRKKL